MFYIKPPRGDIHLDKLLDLSQKRLEFLFILDSRVLLDPEATRKAEIDFGKFHQILTETPNLSEAVFEGSVYDRASHFFLRYSSTIYSDLKTFFIDSETKFFSYRLQSLDDNDLIIYLNELERHLSQILPLKIAKDLLPIVQDLLISNFTQLNDEDEMLRVPFELVESLVASRKVFLKSGIAKVLKSNLYPFLSGIFRKLLLFGLEDMKVNIHRDDRLLMIAKNIYSTFKSSFSISCGINAAEIPNLARTNFPPCMRKLQLRLENESRLDHNSRIAYTLFLKEIGLPLDQSIVFWKRYYSESGSSKTCSHSWKTDSKKIIYSINHAYGKEGCRKDYSAHGCKAIRDMKSWNSSLKCPFTLSIFSNSEFDDKDIEDLVKHEEPGKACLRTIYKDKIVVNKSRLKKPSEYYIFTKES